MNQPLYIAPDEEIISVIARLRALPDDQVTLVFPKHSVVTQSIINLKLLAREGEKLQKKLTLVSQNENARSLAEKIGFATLPYTQEMERGSIHLPNEAAPTPKPAFAPEADPAQFRIRTETTDPGASKLKSADIGSQNFYQPSSPQGGEGRIMGDVRREMPEVPPVAPSTPTTLRVRNMSPERPPSLNSLRTEQRPPEKPMADLSSRPVVSSPTFPDTYQTAAPAPVAPELSFARPAPQQPTAIQNFFSRPEGAPVAPAPRGERTPLPPTSVPFIKKEEIPKKAAPVMVGNTVSSKLTGMLIALAVLLVGATGALGFFLIFPSATVVINPQTVSDSYDQSFTVDAASGSTEVPLQKQTQELTVSIAGIASGAAGTPSNAGTRAKGTIKITNNFSNEAQPLVATTRFEANGKIYRIQENISVPGNGSIEAAVVADGSGESYNISEGTLTIPGFKGTTKYDKITAVVTGAITGGGGNETESSGTFIRADEETLRTRASEEAKRVFSQDIDNENSDTYTFTEGLQIERINEANLPKVGSVPGEYEYSATFKITAYTTSKESVTKAVLKNIRSEYDGITFIPKEQDLSFTDFTLTENNTKASLKAHLDTTLQAKLDEVKIKEDLAGKAAPELENFTTAHPEIKSLSITFNPSWALKRIPKNPDKIELVTE